MSETVGKRLQAGGFWQLLGMQVLHADAGKAQLTMPVTSEHLQAYGVIHGGALASLIDAAIGLAVHTTLGPDEATTTTNLNVMYSSPAHEGLLLAEASLVRRGGTIIYGDCRIEDTQGRLIAHGSATYMILQRSRWAKPVR